MPHCGRLLCGRGTKTGAPVPKPNTQGYSQAGTPEEPPAILLETEPNNDLTQHDRKVRLLALMADGKTMTQACREIGITRQTIWRWRKDDPDFDGLYEDAHKAMAVAIADDGLTMVKELADGTRQPTKELVAAASAYSQRASWYASKLLPKVYGDEPTKIETNFNQQVNALVCTEQQRLELIELRHKLLPAQAQTEQQTEHDDSHPDS